MDERGLIEAASRRLSVALAAAAVVPVAGAVTAAAVVGGGGERAALMAALATGAGLTLLVVAVGRVRLLAGAQEAVLLAPFLDEPRTGSLQAMSHDGNLADVLSLVSDRLDRLAGRAALAPGSQQLERLSARLSVLGGTDADPRAQVDADVEAIVARGLAACDDATGVSCSLDAVTVRGDLAGDLALIVAELVDNAVAFAAPGTTVSVVGRHALEGYSLAVVDEGVELEPSQRQRLNEEMRSPPSLALRAPASFGLPVVARLAVRHGLAVRLLEWATEGVVAKVVIPPKLLAGGAWTEPPTSADAADALDAAERPSPLRVPSSA